MPVNKLWTDKAERYYTDRWVIIYLKGCAIWKIQHLFMWKVPIVKGTGEH